VLSIGNKMARKSSGSIRARSKPASGRRINNGAVLFSQAVVTDEEVAVEQLTPIKAGAEAII
jgi:hypothetical protein